MRTNLKKELLKAKKEKFATKLIAIRLPSDVYDKLKDLSKETGETMSQVIIFALRKALNDNK